MRSRTHSRPVTQQKIGRSRWRKSSAASPEGAMHGSNQQWHTAPGDEARIDVMHEGVTPTGVPPWKD